MKKLLSLLLALGLCLGLAIPASASNMGMIERRNTISTGNRFSAFIDENGTLWTCGENYYGTLGIGTHGNHGAYTPVKVMEDVFSVSCGESFIGAIKNDGSLWMWGYNFDGELGNGGGGNVRMEGELNAPIQTVPLKIMDDVAAISCGSGYTHSYAAAVKTDGSLWMWGVNWGQFGNGTNESSFTPVKVMDGVKAVSCGSEYTAILKTDNSLWMTGRNASGEMGNGRAEDVKYTTPVKVMDDVAYACCGGVGEHFVAAIKLDGSLWMWGDNRTGQLGIGTTESVYSPVKVMDDVATVSCGSSYIYGNTAAVKTDGSLWVWGSNYRGQLGLGSNGNANQLTPVKVLDDVVDVSVSTWCQTMAVTSDGSLWAWGDNTAGQLGNGGLGNLSYTKGGMYTVPYRVQGGIAVPSTSVTGSPAVAGFSDVYESDYFADAVVWAKENGVTGGTSADTFSPDRTVTRAEAVTFLWRAAGSPRPASAASPFADVTDSGAYYYDAVLWTYEQGIVGGVGNRQFSLYGTLTYDQILAMLCRAAGGSAAGGDWSSAAVDWAAENGLTDGLTFSAKGSCPRADVVYCLWKQLA